MSLTEGKYFLRVKNLYLLVITSGLVLGTSNTTNRFAAIRQKNKRQAYAKLYG